MVSDAELNRAAGLLRQGASGLTGVSNSIGKGDSGLAALIRSGRLAR